MGRAKSKPAAAAQVHIEGCVFTNTQGNEVALTLARALEANANALNTLADSIKSQPMLMIGGPSAESVKTA